MMCRDGRHPGTHYHLIFLRGKTYKWGVGSDPDTNIVNHENFVPGWFTHKLVGFFSVLCYCGGKFEGSIIVSVRSVIFVAQSRQGKKKKFYRWQRGSFSAKAKQY